MQEATERIERTAKQLTITDRLLESVDQEYRLMRQKLLVVPSYSDFLNTHSTRVRIDFVPRANF